MDKKIIYSWDNVDYDYPSCGGSEGKVYDDGTVEIKRLSNMQGCRNGATDTWMLSAEALAAITIDADADYNNYNSWADMLQGDGIAYIATLISTTNGILVQ